MIYNKTALENGIKLISHFLAQIESTETNIEEKETALNGIHNTVKAINGRNLEYADFMETLGRNKNNIQEYFISENKRIKLIHNKQSNYSIEKING